MQSVFHRRAIGAIAVALGALAAPAAAQSDLENVLEQFTALAVQGYTQPLADLSGSNMHSGYYHSARIPNKWSFSISAIGMAASVSDEQRTYSATTPAGFTPTTFQTATIFGGAGTTVADQGNPALTYRGTDGLLDTSWWPSVIPQLNLSVGIGTEFLVRWANVPKIDDFPGSTLLGGGVRHSLNRYLTNLPLDLAAGVFYSNWRIKDLVDMKGVAFGLQGSKDFSSLSLYGGAMWENSTMNINYTYVDPANPANTSAVSVDLEGEQAFRFTAGAGLKLGFFRLFGDANFGATTTFSGGFSLGY